MCAKDATEVFVGKGVDAKTAEKLIEAGYTFTKVARANEKTLREIEKIDPSIRVFQKACPLLVPIIEAGEQDWEGAGMIVRRYLGELMNEAGAIDALLLACTHYPILYDTIRRNVPAQVEVLEQGPVVAEKLRDYLRRHPEMERKLTRGAARAFLTTDLTDRFDRLARTFFGEPVRSQLVSLE